MMDSKLIKNIDQAIGDFIKIDFKDISAHY